MQQQSLFLDSNLAQCFGFKNLKVSSGYVIYGDTQFPMLQACWLVIV